MKYIIKGAFNTGDEWSETANNKSELEYIVHKVLQNECVAYYDVNMFYKVMSYYESDPSMISTDGYFKDYEKTKEYIYKGNKQIVEGVKSNSVTTFKNIISDEHYEIHKVFFNDSEV